MARAKIAITLDQKALSEIDRLVKRRIYPNRSRAIEAAIEERIARHDRSRLAEECAKLNESEEQSLADEGYAGETQWPEY